MAARSGDDYAIDADGRDATLELVLLGAHPARPVAGQRARMTKKLVASNKQTPGLLCVTREHYCPQNV